MAFEQKNTTQDNFVDEIVRFFESQPYEEGAVDSFLDEYHPADIAAALSIVDEDERIEWFKQIDMPTASDVFAFFSKEDARLLLKTIPDKLAQRVIGRLDNDDIVDLLQSLDDQSYVDTMLSAMSRPKRQKIKQLWDYKDNQLGSVMTDSFITLDANMTVKEAMKTIIEHAYFKDYTANLFVIDDHRLTGVIPLKNLIVARAKERIYDIMDMNPLQTTPDDNKEHAALRLAEYGESAMAVVDKDGMMLGILTYDDAMDIIAEEKEDDYTALAALSKSDIDLHNMTIMDQVRGRLPWLLILLVLGLLTSLLLSIFETPLSQNDGSRLLASRLAVYLPLLLGMAGNAGTQSLAIMIRYLTGGNPLKKKAMKQHLLREFRTGFLQGLLIGVLLVGMILVQFRLIDGHLTTLAWYTAGVGGLSIFIALIAATFLGALIPYALDKLGFDPTVASGPFITTISDVLSLTIYYGVALIVLLPIYV